MGATNVRQQPVLIVENSLEVDCLFGKIGKSRVIDPPLLVGWLFSFKLAASCQTLDKVVSRKASTMWIIYFRFQLGTLSNVNLIEKEEKHF